MKKILVTLGPSSMIKEVVTKLTEIGVHLFRINLSHTALDSVEQNIKLIRSWTDVPICLDSEGAQLRNGIMSSEQVFFEINDKITVSNKPITGNSKILSFNPTNISDQFKKNDEIQVDFNHVKFKITKKHSDFCEAIVINSGIIGSNKAADINRDLNFEPLTIKDKEAIKIGLKNGIKNFAMSFTNKPEDVELMRDLCGHESNIICKIESPSGIKNLEKIIQMSDEILIDRGDLSRRIPIEKIPFLQRCIILTARNLNTPVYVATNLLETMIKTKSPTRAEVNDVVSTLEMGANGLVLAAETAIGNYPIQSVQMIKNLIVEYNKFKNNSEINNLISDT